MTDRRRSRFDRRKQSAEYDGRDRRNLTPPEFYIQIETRESNLIVKLNGVISADNAYTVKESILTAQKPSNIKNVLLNLNKLTYIDSLAISYFVEIKKLLTENGKHLILLNPSNFIKQIMEILNLETVFDIREINIKKG